MNLEAALISQKKCCSFRVAAGSKAKNNLHDRFTPKLTEHFTATAGKV